MKIFDKDSIIFEYRCLFNGYPTVDEISAYCDPYDEPENIFNKDKVIIDDYYGRCFTGEYLNLVKCPYGENTRLPYYDHGGRMRLPIEGVLRVPYRKIPIHRICNLWEAQLFITQIIDYNPNYQILLRGQNKIYPTSRDKKDLEFLYGSEEVIEPSFLPSFCNCPITFFCTLTETQ